MSSADTYIVNHSMAQQSTEYIFEKKEMIYTVDDNNSSYSNGVVHFSLASVSNAGRPVDFRNSVLVIPYTIRMSGAITENAINAYAVSLKNHVHVIDSMSVQLSNHNVVEPQEFSNIPCSFKLLTEMSEQELQQYGYSIGFHKDNAHSINADADIDTVQAPRYYEANNNPSSALTQVTTVGSTFSQIACNPAQVDRMLDSSYDITGLTEERASNLIGTGKRHCKRVAAAGGVPAHVLWHGLITLPLRFLNSFFDAMPLVRNSFLKMSFTTNLISRSTVTVSGTGEYTVLSTALSAKTCPYMIAQNGKGVVSSGAGQIVVESGIGRLVSAPNVTNPLFTACRLYTPVYTFAPAMEEQYFSQAPKKINYSAYVRAVSPTIAVGHSLNSFLVTNSLSRIRSVLVFPVDATRDNMLSPFSSCPTTSAPYAFVSNFNVRIGGSPHYAESQLYGWENFQQEIASRGVNGNLELGLGSGLLNECIWNAGYRFLYVDLSKKASSASDDTSKSVILEGKNISGQPLVFHVFVEYEKSITVNQSTGQLVLA